MTEENTDDEEINVELRPDDDKQAVIEASFGDAGLFVQGKDLDTAEEKFEVVWDDMMERLDDIREALDGDSGRTFG